MQKDIAALQLSDTELHDVAHKYYVQQETMDTIARQRQVSRSTISRILKQARDRGIVKIVVAPRPGARGTLAGELQSRFGVRATVVDVPSNASEVHRLEKVSRSAAHQLDLLIEPGAVVGIAWGTTLAEVARHLPRNPTPNVTIVQLNGAANPTSSGIPYAASIISKIARAWDADVSYFTVPAFFDYAETKQALWREASVRRVLALQNKVSIAVFGVGAFSAPVPSYVYSGGYMDTKLTARLQADGVVGDICTVLLREDGTFADVEINNRATGPSPAELALLPRRLCIVAGTAKTSALAGALRTGAITDLVVDEATAQAVIDRTDPTEVRRTSRQDNLLP